MKILLAGYREWAYKIFRYLLESQKGKKWKIETVLTTTTQEMSFAHLSLKTLVYEPSHLKSEKLLNDLQREKPDCILFYGWSWIVSKEVLELAKCICLHPSPLPKYRGGSPIQNQIFAGEKESAVTLIFMTEGLDAGDILAQKKFSLEGNLCEILDRIVDIGCPLTVQVLDSLAEETLKPKPQDESEATFCKRRSPEDSEITIEEIRGQSAEYLYNKIRALQDPYPNAYIKGKDGKKIFLVQAKLEK